MMYVLVIALWIGSDWVETFSAPMSQAQCYAYAKTIHQMPDAEKPIGFSMWCEKVEVTK